MSSPEKKKLSGTASVRIPPHFRISRFAFCSFFYKSLTFNVFHAFQSEKEKQILSEFRKSSKKEQFFHKKRLIFKFFLLNLNTDEFAVFLIFKSGFRLDESQ
ncbi:MAG TPA: hypothetical protein DDZ11_06660 [Lentisphaeria bacterium]|nr:hypothetical protein [Lentisphaeria bacterium]